MEMLLVTVVFTLMGLVITLLGFGALTSSDEESTADVVPEAEPAARTPGNFFANDAMLPGPAETQVPMEAFLLQLEQHIRLEREAAQSFLETPRPAMLWTKTKSPFVH